MQLSRSKCRSTALEIWLMPLRQPLTLRTFILDPHLSTKEISGRPRKPETESDLMRETVQAVKGITADGKGMTQEFKKLALQAQQNHNDYWPANANTAPECFNCGRKGHRAAECKVQPMRQSSANYSSKGSMAGSRRDAMLGTILWRLSDLAIALHHLHTKAMPQQIASPLPMRLKCMLLVTGSLRTGSLPFLMQSGKGEQQKRQWWARRSATLRTTPKEYSSRPLQVCPACDSWP